MKINFNDVSDWFKDKFNLANQNGKIRKSKKKIERKYNNLVEEMSELTSKYIDLLEQKSTSFDLYLNYKNQCEELTKEKREFKRQNALLTETVNSQEEELLELYKKVEKKKNGRTKNTK